MTSEECIDILKNRLIALVNSGQLKATYNQSNSTISFYVNDISVEERPLLTLRVSDHRPTYQNYIHTDLTPPSPEENTNVSIEFYKPKYNKKGKKIKDKVNSGVQVPQNVDDILPFVINSYKYTPELLEKADVEEIYNAILNWINGGLNAIYIDPFANTHKKAKVQTKIANIKWNISHNISVDNDGNYVSANGWGADYVSETRDIYNKNKRLNCNRNMKQTIKLTESELRGMIGEAVNEAVAYRTKRINEGNRNNAVKLTESQLRNFINAAVNEALNEMNWKTYMAAAKKDWENGNEERAERFAGAAEDAFSKEFGHDEFDDELEYYGEKAHQNVHGVNFTPRGNYEVGVSSWTPHVARMHSAYNPKYNAEISNPDSTMKPSKKTLDAYNRAKDELQKHADGKYKYQKGKGWQ